MTIACMCLYLNFICKFAEHISHSQTFNNLSICLRKILPFSSYERCSLYIYFMIALVFSLFSVLNRYCSLHTLSARSSQWCAKASNRCAAHTMTTCFGMSVRMSFIFTKFSRVILESKQTGSIGSFCFCEWIRMCAMGARRA